MMVHFSNPWFLLSALAVPLLAWLWLRRRRGTLRYPDAKLFSELPAGRRQAAVWGGVALRTLGLLLIVFALAGPGWPDQRTRIPTEGIAIEILLDVSGSMATEDFDWQGKNIARLDAAKRALKLFVAGGLDPSGARLDGRPNDSIGLVTFATWPDAPCPLTLSHSVLLQMLAEFQVTEQSLLRLRSAKVPEAVVSMLEPLKGRSFTTKSEFLEELGKLLSPEELDHYQPEILSSSRIPGAVLPRSVPGDSETNISDALALGLHRLESAGTRRKVMVLISDGEHNVPQPQSQWKPRQAAGVAASLKVPIYAIDAGGESGLDEGAALDKAAGQNREKVRVSAEKTLREVASISDGRYFQVRDGETLLAVCRDIDRLEKQEIQSFKYRRYHDLFPWLGVAALALFFSLQLVEMTTWRRAP